MLQLNNIDFENGFKNKRETYLHHKNTAKEKNANTNQKQTDDTLITTKKTSRQKHC